MRKATRVCPIYKTQLLHHCRLGWQTCDTVWRDQPIVSPRSWRKCHSSCAVRKSSLGHEIKYRIMLFKLLSIEFRAASETPRAPYAPPGFCRSARTAGKTVDHRAIAANAHDRVNLATHHSGVIRTRSIS